MTDTDRPSFTARLRAFADILDANPALPRPLEGVSAYSFFIRDDINQALILRDLMDDPDTEQKVDTDFPVQIVGHIAGLECRAYVHAQIALIDGAAVVMPPIDPRLIEGQVSK